MLGLLSAHVKVIESCFSGDGWQVRSMDWISGAVHKQRSAFHNQKYQMSINNFFPKKNQQLTMHEMFKMVCITEMPMVLLKLYRQPPDQVK